MSKIILITGTSSGLGIRLAVQAAQAHHTVYATMRNLDKRGALDEAAAQAGVELNVLQLDVQDTASVTDAVHAVLGKEGRIDTLINNAGAGFVRTLEQASEADVNWVMDVNFMGVVRCTKAVLPSMRKARSGHVITVSSVGGLVGQPFNEIYCAAKFAVEGFTEALACYVSPNFGVHFTAIEPGGIHSEFAANVLKHLESTGGMPEDEYLPIFQTYVGGSGRRQDGSDIYQTADEVASVVMECVEADNPPVRRRTSTWGEGLTRFKTELDPTGEKQRASVIEQFLT
ncbi:MAG: SDR family oxidoreductase [Acidobacteriota bacterium]